MPCALHQFNQKHLRLSISTRNLVRSKKKDTQLALKENGSWENNGRCTQNGNVTSYFSEEEIIVIEAHFQTRKLARTRE
jgi:hypothetical protein